MSIEELASRIEDALLDINMDCDCTMQVGYYTDVILRIITEWVSEVSEDVKQTQKIYNDPNPYKFTREWKKGLCDGTDFILHLLKEMSK